MNFQVNIGEVKEKGVGISNKLKKVNSSNNFADYKSKNFLKKFFNDIKKKVPEVNIEIKNISNNEISLYYEKIQSEGFGKYFEGKIVISPVVKNKIEKDNDYAYKVLSAILSTGIIKNIDDLKRKLYELDIFVKDNGELEVVTCMDADYKEMQREKMKLDQKEAIRKDRIKKKINNLKSVIYSRYRYENNKFNLINRSKGKRSFVPYSYFLSQSSELKRLQFDLNS